MSEVKEKQPEIYVWSKTERAGDIVVVNEATSDRQWLGFQDGSRINRSLVNEMLLRTPTMEEAERTAKTFGAIANVPTPVETTEVTTNAPTERRITDGKSVPEPEVNVMMEMLKKISKKNQAEMPVQVNIPAKAVYEMLQDQMDLTPEDLNEQIGLLVESQIDSLRDQLKSQIETFITNYYTNGNRKSNKSS